MFKLTFLVHRPCAVNWRFFKSPGLFFSWVFFVFVIFIFQPPYEVQLMCSKLYTCKEYDYIHLGNYHHQDNKHVCHLQVSSCSFVILPSKVVSCLSLPTSLHFLEFYINWITQYVFCLVCILSKYSFWVI